MYFYFIFALLLCSVWSIPTTLAENSTDIVDDENGLEDMEGGVQASEDSHLYMAGLVENAKYRVVFCGGSILTEKTILTAAHCVVSVFFDGSLSSSLRVIVGTKLSKKGGDIYRVSHNVSHPLYQHDEKKNDIAILITTTNIAFTDAVKPIHLDYDFQDEIIVVQVSGWGVTQLRYPAKTLMTLILETISGDECLAKMPPKNNGTDAVGCHVDPLIEICTYHSLGHGTCIGDSGGPLVRLDNDRQIGVVSWGYPCAIGAPDVHARISAYKDWLQKVIV